MGEYSRDEADMKLQSHWSEFAAAEPEMAARGRQLVHRRGDGEGFLATVAGDDLPRVHPVNVGVVGDQLLVFVQSRSAKAMDLEADGRYALHAHQDPAEPDEFLLRGRARLVDDPSSRAAAAKDGSSASRTTIRYTSCSTSSPFWASAELTSGRRGIGPGAAKITKLRSCASLPLPLRSAGCPSRPSRRTP